MNLRLGIDWKKEIHRDDRMLSDFPMLSYAEDVMLAEQ
jgi:hypothetical protein